RKFRADLPGEIVELIMKALAKTPAERWESAAAFLEAVREVEQRLFGMGAPILRPVRTEGLAMAAAGASAEAQAGRRRAVAAVVAVSLLGFSGLMALRSGNHGHASAAVGAGSREALGPSRGGADGSVDVSKPAAPMPGTFKPVVEYVRFPVKPVG